MNLTRDRLHSIGWAFVLTVCFALTMALTFRVNAVKSEVRLAEREIVRLKQQKMFLETEFLTRANQQQLRNLNEVEFGYQAPTAAQYIEGERQLAVFSKARAPGSPEPIRVASAPEPQTEGFPAMVSPLSGVAVAAELPEGGARRPLSAADLQRRLTRVEPREGAAE